jgi:hypothetical protein
VIAHCYKCLGFIPDPHGAGGIGQCLVIVRLKEKGAPQNIIDAEFKKLGNQVFWGGQDERFSRECYRFKQKIPGVG